MVKHALAALGLVLLALALRLPRLVETPAWDGDEGYNVELAWQLLQGRAQAFAVTQSYVQHPVLYYALLAPLLALFGPELGVARALSAVSSALACGVLYLAVYQTLGVRAAVLGGLALAGMHFVVLHNRLAYSYNLLLLFTALTALCAERFEAARRKRWLVAGAGAAALGLLTDQVGIALPWFMALRALPDRRRAGLALALGLTPAAVLALGMLVIAPEASLTDWGKSLSRVAVENPGGASGPGARLALWFVNYLHLLRAEWWWPAAIVGLFVIRDLGVRRRWLSLAGLIVIPTFALRELEPFFRTAIPLFLPGAVGLGALLDAGMRRVYGTISGRVARAAAAAFVVFFPLGLELARAAGAAATDFRQRFVIVPLVIDQDDARAAATHVNARVETDSVVLVSPHVAWLYRSRVADFFQAVAWTGEPIAFYPGSLSRARFVFEPSVERARYVVIDPFWRRWTEVSPSLARLTLRIESWPEELRAGEVSVRRNPAS